MVFSTYNNIEQYLNGIQRDETHRMEDDDVKPTYDVMGESDVSDIDLDGDRMSVMADEVSRDTIVNSHVIAASVNGRRDHVTLSEPVLYTLEHITVRVTSRHDVLVFEL